jgi:hypothetical protein
MSSTNCIPLTFLDDTRDELEHLCEIASPVVPRCGETIYYLNNHDGVEKEYRVTNVHYQYELGAADHIKVSVWLKEISR